MGFVTWVRKFGKMFREIASRLTNRIFWRVCCTYKIQQFVWEDPAYLPKKQNKVLQYAKIRASKVASDVG